MHKMGRPQSFGSSCGPEIWNVVFVFEFELVFVLVFELVFVFVFVFELVFVLVFELVFVFVFVFELVFVFVFELVFVFLLWDAQDRQTAVLWVVLRAWNMKCCICICIWMSICICICRGCTRWAGRSPLGHPVGQNILNLSWLISLC